MKTCEGDNTLFFLSSFLGKKVQGKSATGTKVSERVIRLGLLRFGIKSPNNLSIKMSSEMTQIIQKAMAETLSQYFQGVEMLESYP